MPVLQTSTGEPKFPLAEGQIVSGALFNEPMRVESIRQNGPDSWVVGLSGVRTEKVSQGYAHTERHREPRSLSSDSDLRGRWPSPENRHSGVLPWNRL